MCRANDPRMRFWLRCLALNLGLVLLVGTAWGQLAETKVTRIEIKHIGPTSVSDTLIRDNIRTKPGNVYRPNMSDADIKSLYATGQFYNIRIAIDRDPAGGVILTYIVQAKPRLTDIKLSGNKKLSDSKLKKKIPLKVGDPLDEQKLFSDSLAMQELYQKQGYPGTTVKYVVNIDENAGRGTATFEIKESEKIKIKEVDFIGTPAFKESKLRKEIKTRRHWWLSWLTGSGVYKDDQFQEDKERLNEFFRNQGYLDFEIKDVQFDYPTPTKMIIKFIIYQGQQYKVGAVTFEGTTMFPTNMMSTNRITSDFKLRPGAVFAPVNLGQDVEKIEDFYGARGHIDVTRTTGDLQVNPVPNTETGTMDLKYKIDEGQKSYVEKIEIRGNTKTKDTVIRRELAISPGETFDMVRVKISKRRLEGLNYFEKVDTRPEATDVPNRKNLIVGVTEKNTGNFSIGAGFSSVDALVGFAEVTQGNFDLFHPPTFTGGGQKLRLRVQLGTERQDYVLSFVEPWFLGRKLAFGTELYYRELNYLSVDNLYDEDLLGARFSLTRALWSDFLIGSVSYTIEDVNIKLNDVDNTPPTIVEQAGRSLVSKVGASLAYDTRNSVQLPDAGQRSEILTELAGGPLGGDSSFYKIEAKTAWYFRGLAKGHVLELTARGGVADGFDGGVVPFYDAYYLGGLYSLRGYQFRSVSPRDPGYDEPVGGNTYWYGSAEYSIPILNKEGLGGVRLAVFYDIGNVLADAYDFQFKGYTSDYGIGLRLNLPIGPLRLDYAIPLEYDSQYQDGKGRFQFGVGYTRDF